MNLFRVRLYVNVPGSLIIAGNSKKPIRKPPSSTKIEEPSMEVKAIPETEADSGNMTRSGAMSMWTLTNLGTIWLFSKFNFLKKCDILKVMHYMTGRMF